MNASNQVRDFYERAPSPLPVPKLDTPHDLYRNPIHRRARFHRIWPTERPRDNQKILIAGCGTSQAARYALREPDAHVTAIDVSESSLRHTRDLQRSYDLGNLDIHRLAIEEVQTLGRCFDLIVCTGVLHHLADPDAGLRALRAVLSPAGAMHLMVYAPYGRAGIYMMQEYCRLLDVGTSETDLRELRTTLEFLPTDHAIAGPLRRAKDFRRPNAMPDALLHRLDRAYTVSALYAWLDRCGMTFGRWIEQAPYLPQCGAVATSPHAARLASLPAPLQHAAVELFRGTMVSHSVIAYRDDRSAESQPIAFAGNRWRGLVPIALPWTVRARENLPKGAVAVLINRAHTFTDLGLPVDAFEHRLLDAIDGTRTLTEIMRSVLTDNDGEHRALRFFERLWRYDQIVFDASLGAASSS
jgi:SAM-dependent methyltransferase